MFVVKKDDLIGLLKAAGLKFEEREYDIQICIDDGNDSIFEINKFEIGGGAYFTTEEVVMMKGTMIDVNPQGEIFFNGRMSHKLTRIDLKAA